jgi:hypothetical protein
VELVLRSLITRDKVFDSLYSSAPSLLTSFFIHIVYVTPWNFFLIQDCAKLHKVFIDFCVIESLCMLWVQTQRLTQLDLRMSLEKSSIPLWRWLPPNDLFNLSKQSSLVKGTCNITLVLNLVTQHLFLSSIEVLPPLMGTLSSIISTQPAITKSVARNFKFPCNLGNIFGVASLEIFDGILYRLLSPPAMDLALWHADDEDMNEIIWHKK